MTEPDNPYSQPDRDDAPPPPTGGPGIPLHLQRWPRIFGIISMALAAAGIVFSPLLMLFNRVNPQGQHFLKLLPPWYEAFTNYSIVLGMAFGAMLLVAGLKLRKQQRTARTLHMFYAAGTLVSVVVGAVITMRAFGSIETAGLSAAERAGVIGGTIGGLFGTVAGAAYPIFLLIWFRRTKIKNDIAMWPED